MDALVLNIIRSADASAAAGLRDLSLGLVDSEQRAPERYFWTVCATFFEALATGLSVLDVANKRLAAQTLRVYMQLARGETPPWDELLPPLRAACALSASGAVQETPATNGLASEPLRLLSGGDAADAQDRVRVIGELRVDIAAYNVFLNDADELSRQLLLELTEWTLEPHRAVLDSTIALAHGLADAARQIGFADLAGFAASLAQVLRHVQPGFPLVPEDGELFLAAAEAVRRLLHQFAAGFLKQPEPAIVQALAQRQIRPASPHLGKAWSGLLSTLGSALRQWTARPDNRSAGLEVIRIVAQVQALARQLGNQALLMAANQMTEHARVLGEGDLAPGLATQLRADAQRLQVAGKAFFTTA
jgi:chemosensory pili system protein ChpA (sensor histidine kinase/response regulator)